jgi:hypothetical protein
MNHVQSKTQQQQQQQQQGGPNDPQGSQQNKSTTGTISGMLADFSRALGEQKIIYICFMCYILFLCRKTQWEHS